MLGFLTDNEIDSLLMSQAIGRVGCHSGGKTIVVPITYAFDGKRIIGNTTAGEKIAFMRANPSVCLEVDQVKDLRNWRSVIVQGRYRELKGEDASLAMSYLVRAVKPHLPSETMMPGHGGASIRPRSHLGESDTIVFCLDILEKTGRFELWEEPPGMSSIPSTR